MVKMLKKELQTKRGRLVLLMGMSLIAAFFVVGAVSKTSAKVSKRDIRNIEFEIRGMAFGNDNPTIQLRSGETVRFIIYNFDKGMKHNFSIEGTDVHTRIINYGEKDSVIFHVPKTEKEMVYLCDLHALTMRGALSVRKVVDVALSMR